MRKQKLIFIGLSCLATMLGACSSEEEGRLTGGTATLALKVQTETSFQTKALNEEEYKNIDNYTVELYSGDELYQKWDPTQEKHPSSLSVPAGTYYIKAYYGEDVAASTDKMYVEGTGNPVTVEANGEQTLSVVCKPTCAKVTVNFSAEMANYFNDYSVVFKTVALGSGSFPWTKTNTNPVYLKVHENEMITADITLVKTSGEQTIVTKTYTLSPNKGLNIHVAPVVQDTTGNIGITIEIDTSTNDHDVDIEVPHDWI